MRSALDPKSPKRMLGFGASFSHRGSDLLDVGILLQLSVALRCSLPSLPNVMDARRHGSAL